jgi:hypothetical protein
MPTINLEFAALTGRQCKAGRALLAWKVTDLATAARVAAGTLIKIEHDEPVHHRSHDAVRQALEAAGIEFLNGTGVRLRQ